MGYIKRHDINYGGGGGSQQEQADWNQSDNTQPDYIKNKPAIPDVTGKYDVSDSASTDLDDGDYIPFYDTSASAKKKSLWSNIKAVLKAYFDNIYLTSHQDISGKADKVSGATNGNFAGLDSNGNLTDSGHKPSDYMLVSDYDSTNAVATAGGIVAYINDTITAALTASY